MSLGNKFSYFNIVPSRKILQCPEEILYINLTDGLSSTILNYILFLMEGFSYLKKFSFVLRFYQGVLEGNFVGIRFIPFNIRLFPLNIRFFLLDTRFFLLDIRFFLLYTRFFYTVT
ncbi:hypothetical protein MSBR3_1453 [Methanosarcina barkeri 3]|uniref:Uncharacterized protein n=1 Tax=Methanosarcina barkeri 3 TaxID=1434107 RepID=A0A0E3SK09_METBA|nr:hypothetical protein MSBR3_1453 [Methanosarcina barkeri 3]